MTGSQVSLETQQAYKEATIKVRKCCLNETCCCFYHSCIIAIVFYYCYCSINGEKLAVMVFKRSVYEPRRKPKGLFRPKQKSNLKELQLVSIHFNNVEYIFFFLFFSNIFFFTLISPVISLGRPRGLAHQPSVSWWRCSRAMLLGFWLCWKLYRTALSGLCRPACLKNSRSRMWCWSSFLLGLACCLVHFFVLSASMQLNVTFKACSH